MHPGVALHLPSPLVPLVDERLGSTVVSLKRDDLIAPIIGGNKFRKLQHLMDHIPPGATVLTFGGAYSNHLRATAAWCRRSGFRSIGVVRGEERPFNDVLAACVADGMILDYLDRATYRRASDPDVIDALRARHGAVHVVPEGGTTTHAVRGCAAIVDEIDQPFDLVMVPVGTGGTLAGIAASLRSGQRAMGISVLRGAHDLGDVVDDLHRQALGRTLSNWTIDHRHHHGGFARRTPDLDAFVDDFQRRHGLRLDHVYVGKMLFALFTMIADGEIAGGTRVVAVITGQAAEPPVPAPTRPT